MKRTYVKKADKEDIQWLGLMRLVEAIILQVLDNVSISGKWYKRDLSLKRLLEKRALLRKMLAWFRDEKWNTWLGIYCGWRGCNRKYIKKNFAKIRKKSVKYCNERIKKKKEEIQNQDKDSARESGDSV